MYSREDPMQRFQKLEDSSQLPEVIIALLIREVPLHMISRDSGKTQFDEKTASNEANTCPWLMEYLNRNRVSEINP